MDVDYLNSSTQAQMDLMTMMMQMEKLPAEFSELLPSSGDYSGGPPPPFYSSLSSASPTIIGPSSTMSFCGTAIQDPALLSPPLYSDSPDGTPTGSMDLMGEDPSLDPRRTSMAAMREMIFRIAAMQPIHIDPESVKPPKRRNVKISKDPQSVAARHRRERISERIRILQRLVPGGTKMDTASMLDEAIHYVKFLKTQVQSLERAAASKTGGGGGGGGIPYRSANAASSNGNNYSCFTRLTYQSPDQLFLNPTQMLS